ncbi:hypothetical protein M0Q97_05260 [Candidatus Dojkabacteria bacterium]|jgi:hypothetical protein|nr:hypothetical protein [Candidatus Dojkabacteria bacterium]
MIKIDKNVYYEICKFMKFDHTVTSNASHNYLKLNFLDIDNKNKVKNILRQRKLNRILKNDN